MWPNVEYYNRSPHGGMLGIASCVKLGLSVCMKLVSSLNVELVVCERQFCSDLS